MVSGSPNLLERADFGAGLCPVCLTSRACRCRVSLGEIPARNAQENWSAQVRANEVTTVTRVTTAAEWDALQTKLDQRVRQLLDEGSDVEVLS